MVDTVYAESLRTREPYHIEHRLLMPDGRIKWVNERCITYYDQSGVPQHSIGTVMDVTELRNLSDKAESQAEQMTALLSVSRDGFWLVDETGMIIDCNQAYAEMIGYDIAEIIGKPVTAFEANETEAEVASNVAQIIAEGFLRIERKHRHRNGSLIDFEISATHMKTRNHIVVFMQDITARKQIEENLLNSQARFSGIVTMAADAIISINPSQNITLFNKAAEMMFGISADEVMGTHIEQLIPHRFREEHRIQIKQFANEHEYTLVHRRTGMAGLRINGEEFPIETSISRQRVDGETIMTVMIRDLSDQRASEATQRKLLKAIDEAGEAVLITDCNAIIEYVNPAFSDITGYSAEEAIGNTPAMLKSDAQDPSFYKDLWSTISRGEVWHGTLIDRRKDGSFYPALMSVAPIHNSSGDITHFVSLQQDMTEYKNLEEQFLQAQKMEAIGTLVGGIAHDFNNMLAAMQGNLFLAKRKISDSATVLRKLENVEQLSARAADMVKQLLTFARKDQVEMRPLPLNALIKEALKLARSAIPENISVHSSICKQALIVNGDATQLQQLLMNLLNNARDAVELVEKPTISCLLSITHPTADFRRKHPALTSDALACITVEDNGCGIPDTVKGKVFEPFFTTKAAGKGTGLGLAIVYGAVESHGGCIEIDNRVDAGVTLRIWLPLIQSLSEDHPPHAEKIENGNGELILLVDDEPMLRTSTAELLDSLGYRVLEAEDGIQALELFAKHQTEIRLILSDVVMPRMGGIDMARHMRDMDSVVPIIFVTGYDRDQVFELKPSVDQSIVMNKPVDLPCLSQCIHRLLI